MWLAVMSPKNKLWWLFLLKLKQIQVVHERSFQEYFLKLYKNVLYNLTCSAGRSDVYNNNNVKDIPTFDLIVITNDDHSSLSYNNCPFCRRSISLHFYSLIFFVFCIRSHDVYNIYANIYLYLYIQIKNKKKKFGTIIRFQGGAGWVFFFFFFFGSLFFFVYI
jgi:hypothetical protein